MIGILVHTITEVNNKEKKTSNSLFLSHITCCLKNKNALEPIYLRRFFLDFTHFSGRQASTQKFYKTWYNKLRRVIKMKKMYQKSLRKMRELPKIISKKEWDKYAIQNNVLTAESLRYISNKNFNELCKEVRANI